MKDLTIFCLFLLLFFSNCSSEKTASPPVKISEPISQKIWTEDDRRFLLSELDRTTNEILKEVEHLGKDQYYFQEDRFRWSIGAIMEHLIEQNELHYRELTVLSHAPEMLEFLSVTEGQDAYLQKHGNAEEKRQAKWYLQPIGRFSFQRQSVDAFLRARDGIRDWVEATDVDLRKHFTFRNHAGEKDIDELKIGDVMDLHQLVLMGIAHTDRHLRQIKKVKKHKNYPKDL